MKKFPPGFASTERRVSKDCLMSLMVLMSRYNKYKIPEIPDFRLFKPNLAVFFFLISKGKYLLQKTKPGKTYNVNSIILVNG